MEFTLESALSPGGMLGHSTYLLLVLSMALTHLAWIRVVVIASALAGISYSYFMLSDPVGVFWETLLIGVNVLRLAHDNVRDRWATFSPEEWRLAGTAFAGLSPARKRRLLDAGQWVDAPAGMALARQGESLTHLVWIDSGCATVEIDGRQVAECGAGDMIGELTILDGDPATATSRLTEDARLWRIEAAVLRRLSAASPEIRRGLDTAIADEMRRKLKRAPGGGLSPATALALG